jgi:signal transduction histidine kinase
MGLGRVELPSLRRALGLLGMRERASQLHLKLTVESAVGEGKALVLRVPYW